jgi:hypothetical protein
VVGNVRHKNLSMRRPDTLDTGRAECATRPTMDTFFTSYEKHLKELWFEGETQRNL